MSYYDISHEVINDYDNEDTKMDNNLNEADNHEFSRAIIEKQIIGRNDIIDYSTTQS